MRESIQNVVVFGAGSFASLAAYCLQHDGGFRVTAFTVDGTYCHGRLHDGLPLVAFEDLERSFPPDSVKLLVHLGYKSINGIRRARYEAARARGYDCIRYVSRRASTWPDLTVGDNCAVYEQAIIQPYARIGSNVIIRSGAHVSHHCVVEDHAFLASGATLGGNVTVGEQSFVGLAAVVRNEVRIAPRSFIGAGAVLVNDTESDCVYFGNPARKLPRRAEEM